MQKFIVAPEAENDLLAIWRYLFWVAGPLVADRIEGELIAAFSGLARTPGKGHRRADLTKSPVLFYTLYQYLVIYQIGDPLQILAKVHGKRDVEQILHERLP